MAAAGKPQRSTLLGFGSCPLCGGKTHIKRRTDEEGKRPYSHCLDETEQGCNHTHYARNATEERLMLAKMRPVATGAPPAPAAPAAAPPADLPPEPKPETPPKAPPPPPAPPPAPKRSSLFGL